MAPRGKLIVIEGNESSGKGDQVHLLVKKLESMGHACETMRFPRYDTPTGKIIRGPLLGKKDQGESYFSGGPGSVGPIVASLYFAADRRAVLQEILEILDSGKHLILGRYVSSSMAHQGGKIRDTMKRKKFFKSILDLEHQILKLPQPDVTVYLHIPSRLVHELKKEKERTKKSTVDEWEYIRNAEEVYLELATLYGWKYVACAPDGKVRSDEEIHSDVLTAIQDVLEVGE